MGDQGRHRAFEWCGGGGARRCGGEQRSGTCGRRSAGAAWFGGACGSTELGRFVVRVPLFWCACAQLYVKKNKHALPIHDVSPHGGSIGREACAYGGNSQESPWGSIAIMITKQIW